MTMTLEETGRKHAGTRAPFSVTERSGTAVAASALAAFAIYGFSNNEPSTVGYVSVVGILGGCLAVVRRHVLPDWLVKGLVVIAIGHLCGGLIRVGDSVLYNTDPGWEVLQYDHVFHATASAFGVAVLWTLTSPNINGRSLALALSAIGALGFGAMNELVEITALAIPALWLATIDAVPWSGGRSGMTGQRSAAGRCSRNSAARFLERSSMTSR